jgi:hypothetical protein
MTAQQSHAEEWVAESSKGKHSSPYAIVIEAVVEQNPMIAGGGDSD